MRDSARPAVYDRDNATRSRHESALRALGSPLRRSRRAAPPAALRLTLSRVIPRYLIEKGHPCPTPPTPPPPRRLPALQPPHPRPPSSASSTKCSAATRNWRPRSTTPPSSAAHKRSP